MRCIQGCEKIQGMGIWTLMSELRVYIIIFMLLASVVLHLVSDRKEDAR